MTPPPAPTLFLPSDARRRPSPRHAVLLAATVGVLAAGCTSSPFTPRTQAQADVYESGQSRSPSAGAQFASHDGAASSPGAAGRERKPAETLTDGHGLPFISAANTPGINVFGEFAGSGPAATPYYDEGKVGFRQHTYVDEGYDADVAVDPRGTTMAFASTRHSRRSDIYLQRTGGLAVTKLTSDPADDAFPCFSPDGRHIAFASNRNGNWDIFVMDADGKNVVSVTTGPSQDLHPSFSPDGQRIAYSSSGRDGQWEIWVADLNGGERTMVGFGLFPVWSPNHAKDTIAFQKARQRGGRWFSLWTMDLVDGEPTNVSEIAVSPNAALVAPSWSPDGKRLVFATVVEPDATQAAGSQDIWTIDADGSRRQRLTDGKGTYATPCWASDGRIYFVSDRGGAESIWSTQADGPNYSQAALDLGTIGH